MTLTQEIKAVETAPSMSTFEYGVYTVYDSVLKQFEPPICLPENKVSDYFKLVVNDVQSKYYQHESDFILNKIGTFNQASGEVESHFIERISVLDSYIDKSRRRYQVMLQVLNYLPCGYFKMPDEMKQTIQEKIDSATMEYVSKYVIPDLDVSQFDTSKVKDIYQNYDKYISQSS